MPGLDEAVAGWKLVQPSPEQLAVKCQGTGPGAGSEQTSSLHTVAGL